MTVVSGSPAAEQPVRSPEPAPRRIADVRTDQVAPFRPAILGIRGGTTAVSVALASGAFADRDWWVIGWCFLIVSYNVFRIVRPVRYVDDTASLVRVIAEVGFHTIAVAATGYWESPFIFALITAVMVAGLARGFGFALRVSITASLAIGLPFLLQDGTTVDDLRTTTQWTVELILVALIAGYARRVTGEADRAHSLALDRLGRLADANTLLYSLHRVAQTLPASLDLQEVLDTTMGRVRDLFDYDAAAVLLFDDTDQTWEVVRFDGPRPVQSLRTSALPSPLRDALEQTRPLMIDDLAPLGGGLAGEARSGLYAALPAREAVVGLLALEHRDTRHFDQRAADLLNGFAEPAALAVDNARWFARLRTVGADEERTRIARDLHDRIGQSLAYLAFELDRIVKADAQGKPVTEPLGQLRSDVRGVIGEVRDTLYDLRTDVTDAKDLPTTVREFLDRVEARSGLETHLDVRGDQRLPLLQERELWRITQEAVTNAERHAKASSVTVSWVCDGAAAILLVTDDGIGFPSTRAGRLDSYGIVGMRERAASIGATLDITGIADVGTTVRCEVRPIT
jgi:signal transduction histidine kinase